MPENNQTPRAQEFYTYQASFSSLANGSDATANISIEADSFFKAQKLTYMADLAAAAQTESGRVIPLCTILITDTGSGRRLMNEAIPIPALFGNGQLPFILPTPKVFKPQSTISIQVANYSAASTYNLYISIHGAKLWY